MGSTADKVADGLEMRADDSDVEEPGPSPMDIENVETEKCMGDSNPDVGPCEPGGKGRDTDEDPPPRDDSPEGSGAMPQAGRGDNGGGLSNHVDALLSETYRLMRQHKTQLREEAHVPKIDMLETIQEVRRRRETRKHLSRTQRREVLQAIAIRVGEPTQSWDEDYQLRLSQLKSETQESSEASDGNGAPGIVVLPPSRKPGSRQLRRRLRKELVGEAEKRRKLRQREEPPLVGTGGCAVGGAITVNAASTGAACSEEPGTQVPRGGSRPPDDSSASAGNLSGGGARTESDRAAPAASPEEGLGPGLFTYGSINPHTKRVGGVARSEDQEHVHTPNGHVSPADLCTTVESTRAPPRITVVSADEGAREAGASIRAGYDVETERACSGANGSQWAESGCGVIGDGVMSEDETNAREHPIHTPQKRRRADPPSGPAGDRFHAKPHRSSRLLCLIDEEEEERSYASRRKRAKALWRLRKGSQASRDGRRAAGPEKAAVASDCPGAATGPEGTTAPGPEFGDRRPPASSSASSVPPLKRRRAVPSIRDWSSQGTSSTQTAELGPRPGGPSDSGVACFYAATDATALNGPASIRRKGRPDHDDAERAVGNRVGILGLLESFAASKRSSIL